RDLPIDQFWNINQKPHFAFREILNNSGRNFILVAPTLGPLSQAGNLTTDDGFTSFITQVMASLAQHSSVYAGKPAPSVKNILLACHSGGGEPMRRIARLTGSQFAGLIKECWGFDCTYSSRDPSEWYNWASANSSKSLFLFSIEGTSTARNAAKINTQGAALPNITLVRSRTSNHNMVPQVYMTERLSAVSLATESYDEAEDDGCEYVPSFYIPESEAMEFAEDAPPPMPVLHQPLMVGNVPFAPQPPAGSYWPLRTSNSAGRRVSYTTINKTTIGNSGRKFLAHRDNRSYNGNLRKYIGTKQNRWHVGIDLFAHRGDEVVACEAGRIMRLQYFYPAKSGQKTYGILVEHSGCLVNYGEVTHDSLTKNNLTEGSTVAAGQVIGFVSDTDMLHFETYALREDHSYHNLQWWNLPETPNAPDGLLNPTQYLLFLQQNGLPLPNAAVPSGNTRESMESDVPVSWITEDNSDKFFQQILSEQWPVLTYDALRSEYANLFASCTVNDN
ncbi:MAG: M23 family metallopeptidase, partial [Williamsia sp.]|nr:M23 family metallopeptidase [Williamsia sp.]